MCIGMGKGAEDMIMEGAELLDRSIVDVVDSPQV